MLAYDDEIQFALPEDFQIIWETNEEGYQICKIVLGKYTDDDGETNYRFQASVAIGEGIFSYRKKTALDKEFSDKASLYIGEFGNANSRWVSLSDRMDMQVAEAKLFNGLSTFITMALIMQVDQEKHIGIINTFKGGEKQEIHDQYEYMIALAGNLHYRGEEMWPILMADETEQGRRLEKNNDGIQFALPKADSDTAAAPEVPTRRRRSQAKRLAEFENQEEAAAQAKSFSAVEKPAPAIFVKQVDSETPTVSARPINAAKLNDYDYEAQQMQREQNERNKETNWFLAVLGSIFALFGVALVGMYFVAATYGVFEEILWIFLVGVLAIVIGAALKERARKK